ncbi:methyl-accepting chemotaxis protein [Poseidonibacter lekithochrous]|uniref:methyl-accepting chemotaxis protein n=1 Tax=Poseidonibacter lekithochrous TaxID=1904463 RepID=UPI0008FC30AF|nr:methyl-accepting chemotaxis protein [Poseidonibacter lekithochrous]QKJ23989.1 MCP-domain signal transduction protein [Poseidonibacter lekithochrous]
MFFNKKKDKKLVLESLDIIEEYLKNNINSIEPSQNSKSKDFKQIESKLNSIIQLMQNTNQQNLTVYGEIMLACEKISDGYTNDKIVATSDDVKLNYIAKSLNSMFDKLNIGINDALDILNQYKSQNYVNKINADVFTGGALQGLLLGINNLQDEITNQMKVSFKQGLILEQDSDELSKKAELLSHSTQEQAVAIEETAAAIEEITSTIKNNNTHVSKMLELGVKVQNTSNSGASLAEETFESMEDINDSTSKAYESVNQISQIAFQTNILSLNAAVEAATAGEAGKGFAVVAQEVRNLATKSAEVAKDIEELMDSLRAKAQNGKNIANKMNEGYVELISDINNTVDLIHEVNGSISEQTTGITQISDSINEIDSAVQNNSAIALDVKNVANKSKEVSSEIVENISRVEFIGKEQISI